MESFENEYEVIRAEPQKEAASEARLLEPQPVGDKNNGGGYPCFPLAQEFNICSRCEFLEGGGGGEGGFSQQRAEQLLSSLAGT